MVLPEKKKINTYTRSNKQIKTKRGEKVRHFK